MEHKLQVLILEDNQADALLIAHELKRSGFSIDWVRVDKKTDFIQEIQNRPDLILADFSLPQFNALEALAILREERLEIPFIVISGVITEETAVRCIKEGANDYLLKDRLGRLGTAVEQALAENRLRQEKVHTEQALAESESKYRNLFEESSEAIFTTDLTGVVTECNPAFETILGYSRAEVLGQQLSNFFASPAETLRLQDARQEHGFARNCELRFRHKSGELLDVLFTESVLQGEQGEGQSFLGIARDITERKRNQREMEMIVSVNAALRNAPNREQMVATVAEILHDLTESSGVAVYLTDLVTGELHLEALAGGWKQIENFHIDFQPEVVAAAFAENAYLRWTDLKDTPGLSLPAELKPLYSLNVLPLISSQENIGLVWLSCDLPCPDEVFRLAQVVASISATAIHRSTLNENNLRALQETEAISTISRILNQNLNLDTIFEHIVQEAVHIIGDAYRAVLHIFDEKNKRLHAVALAEMDGDRIEVRSLLEISVSPTNEFDFGDLEAQDIRAASMRAGQGIAGRVIESGNATIVNDTLLDDRYLHTEIMMVIRSIVVTPILSGNLRLGTLSVLGKAPNLFNIADQKLLEKLCLQVAIAIENARLFEAERQQRELAQTQAKISAQLSEELEGALATEKATRLQLIQADKLAGMGRMVASVAHELNNPLQTIKNCLFLIDQSHSDDPDSDLLVLALSEVERLSSIVNRLQDVYRPVANQKFEFSPLTPTLIELELLLETHLRRNKVTLEIDRRKSEGVIVQAFPDQLKQVFLNLSLNAIEAMQPDGGVLTINVRTDPEGENVGISFSDTGHGIPEDDLKVIFDPFYTTKTTGMGLGLSICYDIVQNHNGYIEVKNNPEVGVTFTVWLPMKREEAIPEGEG